MAMTSEQIHEALGTVPDPDLGKDRAVDVGAVEERGNAVQRHG